MVTESESQIKHRPDHWSLTSDHQHHVERTVHPVIVELIKWATQTLPPDSSSAFLDDACGRGNVTAEVKKSFPDLPVLAIDSSAGMLEAVNRKTKKHDWKNVTTRLLDAGNLHGVSSDSITHAFACTYIDLAHNATGSIKQLQRVIAPGGILGMNTWADPIHPSISTPWTKACQQVYPEFKAPLVSNPKWTTPDQIKDNLEKAGFKDVQTKQVITHWKWASLEEMMDWFFDGGNPVCGRWHEALVEEVGGKLEGMRERFREELVKEYREEGGHLLKEESMNLTIARK